MCFFSRELLRNGEPSSYVEKETVSTLNFAAQSSNDVFVLLCIFCWNVVWDLPLDSFCNVNPPSFNWMEKSLRQKHQSQNLIPLWLRGIRQKQLLASDTFLQPLKETSVFFFSLLTDHWFERAKDVNRTGFFVINKHLFKTFWKCFLLESLLLTNQYTQAPY